MTPELVTFAIRAMLRVGNAANSALSQYARDKAAVFPDLREPEPNLRSFVTGFFAQADRAHFVLPGTGEYAEFWTDRGPDPADPRAVDALYIAILKIRSEEHAGRMTIEADAAAGSVMIEQWADAREPAGPLARVLVTVADIALEYVAANPSLAGVDGRGEKLLVAFAGSFEEMLPDDGSLGPKLQLAERLFAVALRAGLETISAQSDTLFDERHVSVLLQRSLTPVVESLPEELDARLDFGRTLEAVSGPALKAALGTIAEFPDAFLGDRFDATTAIGAVTQAVLRGAEQSGFDELFGRGGLETIYRAALGVAATRPELFRGAGDGIEDEIARRLISRFATVLQENAGRDDFRIAAELGAVVLQTVRENVHLFPADDEWDLLAADLAAGILGAIQSGIEAGGGSGLGRVFSRAQAIELGRVVLRQVARTPSMITGGTAEVRRLVTLVATLAAEDEDLLLTGDDWLAIAAVILDEAAANPARLFAAGDGEAATLAESLIRTALSVAAANLRGAGRDGGALLFGETLRETVTSMIVATAGNSAAARAHLDAIRQLLERLSEFVARHKDRFGSREWLALFDELLARVLGGATLDRITLQLAESILEDDT